MLPVVVSLVCVHLGMAEAQEPTPEDVRTRLTSDFHHGLYARTYQSLLARVEPSGYFEESLTGAYTGMFPRTVGGLVSLFLETGELDRCQALIGYVLRATALNDMERIPHVIGREQRAREPVPGSGSVVQVEHPIALYRLDQPERYGGAQEFVPPAKPLRAIELWLSGDRCTGLLRLEVARALEAPACAVSERDAAGLSPAGGWVRFEFDPPLAMEPATTLVARVSYHGEGVPIWWGVDNGDQRQFGGGHGRDTQIQPGWFHTPGHVTAFALDTGDLQHVERQTIPVLCSADQIDGQAHVILAWSRLALRRGPTDFEENTYTQVARLMDRSSDWPYVTPYHPKDRPHTVLTQLGLVRNVCFEHSREGRFWECYDLLSQVFVAAALTEMTRVAHRRGDSLHAARWASRLRSLEAAVGDHMIQELDGKTVYLEMRLPNGGGGRPFEGLGWVNLSPIAAQWKGVNRQVLRNTIEAYRRRALFEWQGKVALALDWWPDRPLDRCVIGKGIGWEIVYGLQEGEWGRICQWLDFIEAVNAPPLYMEAAALTADGKWHVGDPGNGEQCSWWCWAMSKVRRAVGLPPGPC